MEQPVREGNYREFNFKETDALIREAATAGAQLVCTFEPFLDGYGFDANHIPIMDDKRIDPCEVIDKSKYVKRLGKYRKTHNAGEYATWFSALSKEQKKANCPSFHVGGGPDTHVNCNKHQQQD